MKILSERRKYVQGFNKRIIRRNIHNELSKMILSGKLTGKNQSVLISSGESAVQKRLITVIELLIKYNNNPQLHNKFIINVFGTGGSFRIVIIF
jgi:hypothetical protein